MMTGGGGTMAGAFTGIGLTAAGFTGAGGSTIRTSVLGFSLESDLGIFLPGSTFSAGGMVVVLGAQPLLVVQALPQVLPQPPQPLPKKQQPPPPFRRPQPPVWQPVLQPLD